MREVGAFEAKNKFSQLLDQVEHGEEIVITRRGKAVAKIVSTEPATQVVILSLSSPDLADVRAELQDRYGTPPDSVLNLLAAGEIRLHCEQLGIAFMPWAPLMQIREANTALGGSPFFSASLYRLVVIGSQQLNAGLQQAAVLLSRTCRAAAPYFS